MKQSLLKLVLLLVIGIAGGSKAMADDVTFYRLVPAAMSGTSQTATINGITWEGSVDFYDGKWTFYPYPNSTGTQQLSSKTAMQQDVTKIVVHHTVDEYITVNSLKLVVNSRSDFADAGKVEEKTISEYNEVMTFTPSLGKSWKNCYFRLEYNVTRALNSYDYKVRFIGADFMMKKNTEMTFTPSSYDKKLDLIHNPTDNTVQVSTPTITPSELSSYITYSSSNTDIATVNETGLVTLKDGGDVDIIASYAGDATHSPCEARCTIHSRIRAYLTKEATSMYYVPVGGTFDAPTISLKRQDTDAVVIGKSITYESSEPSIAAVDPATGAVTIGSKVGSAGISATFTDDGYFTGSTNTYIIVVQQPSIVVAETSKECNAEKSYLYIGATQTHISTANVVWYEDDRTTTTTCDWITTGLTDSNLELTVSANSGAARHAVLRIEGEDVLGNSVVSDFITITQKSPVLAWDLKIESFEQVGDYNIWGRTLHDPIEMSYPSANCSVTYGTSTTFSSSSDKLVITPKQGVTISTITFTATTSGDAEALSKFTCTNGVATDDDYKVIVTPSSDGTQPIEISIGSDITLTGISIDYSGNEIYTRSVNPGDFGTIYFEHRAIIEGVKLYQVAGKELDTNGTTVTSIVLEEVAGNETAGMVPYVFKATSSELRATLYERNDMGAGSYNGLYGNIDAAEVGRFKGYENLYMFTTTHLQAADASTSSLGANRAYIMMELVPVYNPSAGVKGIRLYFDETTGIGLTESTEKTEGTEGVIYNLNGQRLNGVQKGINIVGGKKVLVK